LEVAHLDGDRANDDPANHLALCHPCHRALDYGDWARKMRATRLKNRAWQAVILAYGRDAARPLLQLETGKIPG